MDKSRYNQRTDTENTVNTENKSRSISTASLSGKSTRIGKFSEINISNDDLSIYVLYGHRESLSILISYQQRIPSKNKRKKPSDNLITRKETIQEPVNPSKGAKEDTVPDVEKSSPRETLPSFKNKVDYKCDTNYKTHGYDVSPIETGGCARNLAKEH